MTADSGRRALGPYGVVYRSEIERIPNPTAVALFALLVTYAHDGVAWPSQATLAEALKVSDRTVKREVATLIAAGVLTKRPRLDRGRKIGTEYLVGSDMGVPSAEVTPVSPTEVTPMALPIPLEQSLEHPAPPVPRRPRARDLFFDAIVEVCGLDENNLTRSESGRVARAKAELMQLDPRPGPDEVRTFARAWRRQHPGIDLTPGAITGNWSRIMRADEQARRRERQRRNDMGVA